MSKATDKLKQKIKDLERFTATYTYTESFRNIAEQALVRFLRRVRSGMDYEEAPFPALDPKYIKVRKNFRNSLDKTTNPSKSNATATGQMLKSLVMRILPTGFILIFSNTGRPNQLTTRRFKKLSAKAKSSLNIKKVVSNPAKKSFLVRPGSFNISGYGGINKRTNLAGQSKVKDISNAELAEHYDKRRNLLGFSMSDMKRIEAAIRKDLREYFKRRISK